MSAKRRRHPYRKKPLFTSQPKESISQGGSSRDRRLHLQLAILNLLWNCQGQWPIKIPLSRKTMTTIKSIGNCTFRMRVWYRILKQQPTQTTRCRRRFTTWRTITSTIWFLSCWPIPTNLFIDYVSNSNRDNCSSWNSNNTSNKDQILTTVLTSWVIRVTRERNIWEEQPLR